MKLCFATVAYGSHASYEDLFKYSVSKAYPESDVLVFNEEFAHYKVSSPRTAAMWRFLLLTTDRVEKYFEDYDYIYITDVDFIICPETPSLLEQHLKHCEVLGLPYSAHMRPYSPKLVAARLFLKREFLGYISPIADAWDLLVRQFGEDVFTCQPRHPDERLLYKLIRLSGLQVPPQLVKFSYWEEFKLMDPMNCDKQLFSPHHGIHLGLGRKKPAVLRSTFGVLFEQPFYRGYLSYLEDLSQQSDFKHLVSQMAPEAAATVERMLSL